MGKLPFNIERRSTSKKTLTVNNEPIAWLKMIEKK